MLAFHVTGALWLCCLVVRRRHPVITICVLATGAVVGSIVTQSVWPDATENGGVWIIAMMLAAYSVGALATGRQVVLGVLLPAVVVLSADVGSRSGWDRINGILWVTIFIGVLPTGLGRAVRARRQRLTMLNSQNEQLARAQRTRQESVALAERLRLTERLQPTLMDGLRRLSVAAESGSEPGSVEAAARQLLARTREEVVALTAPVALPPVPAPPAFDHLPGLRAAAQPWTVLAAGAVVAGLYIETMNVLTLTAPAWVVLPAALLVGAPVALAWWRPLPATALAWTATAGYSHLVAPLADSLTETAVAVCTVFVVAALCRRRAALLGLVVCWAGQVGTAAGVDAAGAALLLLVCWLGGLAVNEASSLVEHARVNNALLAEQGPAAAERAVVGERLRLAREIHDAVGHSLTVVALQAAAARRLADHDPGRAREVMSTVAAAAADGVAVLDHEAGAGDVTIVMDRLRAAGLDIESDVADAALLDAAHRLVLVRIVQEGLTNVVRHAPGASVTVSVRRHHDVVEVVIGNSAPGGAGHGPGSGRGLVGLRERLADAGDGEVTWGPVPGGGFELRALLPQRSMSAADR